MGGVLKFFVRHVAVLLLCGCTYQSTGPIFSSFLKPSNEYATLYLLRTSHAFAGAVWPTVFIDEKKIADIKNGTYTVVHVPSGSYTLRTEIASNFPLSADWNSQVRIDVESGRLYYIQLHRELQQKQDVKVAGGVLVPSNNTRIIKQELRLLSTAEAADRLRGLRYEDPIVKQVSVSKNPVY